MPSHQLSAGRMTRKKITSDRLYAQSLSIVKLWEQWLRLRYIWIHVILTRVIPRIQCTKNQINFLKFNLISRIFLWSNHRKFLKSWKLWILGVKLTKRRNSFGQKVQIQKMNTSCTQRSIDQLFIANYSTCQNALHLLDSSIYWSEHGWTEPAV